MKFIGNDDQKSMIHIINKKNPFDYFAHEKATEWI